MDTINRMTYKRRLSVERPMLMLPLNVVMMARVKGVIADNDLMSAIRSMKAKHPLLSVRVTIDEKEDAWFDSGGVPDAEIQILPRNGMDQWMQSAKNLYQRCFDYARGPLIRFLILKDTTGFDLLICAHHVICDGISLTYLIRDILEAVTVQDKNGVLLVTPPEITEATATNPPVIKGIPKWIIGLINRIWRKNQVRFSFDDFERLNQAYWKQHQGMNMRSWEVPPEITEALVNRCRKENVTVNTALWTAFMMAQAGVQGNGPKYRNNAGLAVSVRKLLNVDVGSAFGFYASSLPTTLKVNSRIAFWDMARRFQKKIDIARNKKNPFNMLISNIIDPSLMDSLYFNKYDLFESKLSKRFLKKMMWDKVNFGYSITNVGRADIPVVYHHLKLDCIYGPLVYSDVNEKTVGVTTTGNKMTFVMSQNEEVLAGSIADLIEEAVTDTLLRAIELDRP